MQRDPKLLYIETFGCQMNKLDSELLLEKMVSSGYKKTETAKEAGVIVFNTCSVRENAENRVYSYLGRLREEKKNHPQLIIAVIGCMAQLQQKMIHRKMPHVDILLGTTQFLKLPEMIQEVRRKNKFLGDYTISHVSHTRSGQYLTTSHNAFISIIRGCDMPCTYCVVPTTRGKMVSKPIEEVLKEASTLIAGGVKEITLLGQTVDAYGTDIDKKLGLPRLLEKLNDLEGLLRIRYITSHPSFITDDLIDVTAGLEKVCEYIHMPAQSGSDEMLKKMKRGYNRKKYMEKILQIQEKMPSCGIASDFIVGYPGESDDHFKESLSLIKEARFQNSYIFKYSRRPGTKAGELVDDILDSVKRERNQELLKLQGQVSLEWKEALLQKSLEVLVDGESKNNPEMLTGRTRSNDIVVFPKNSLETEQIQGQLVFVKLVRANSYTLYGELVKDSFKLKEMPLSYPV